MYNSEDSEDEDGNDADGDQVCLDLRIGMIEMDFSRGQRQSEMRGSNLPYHF